MTLLSSWPCQDNAASFTVVETVAARNATTTPNVNTSTISTTGPGGLFPLALHLSATQDFETLGTFDFGALALMTWSFWIKTTDATTGARVIGGGWYQHNPFTDTTFTTLKFTFSNIDRTLATGLSPAINDGNWKNIVITYSDAANQLKGYINGSQVGSTFTETNAFSHAAAGIAFNNFLPVVHDICGIKIFDSLEDPAALYAEKIPTFKAGFATDTNQLI